VQLHQKRKELEKAGFKVLVISFETIDSSKEYLDDTSLDWPVLVDDQKRLYKYFGMGEAGFWDIWGYRTVNLC